MVGSVAEKSMLKIQLLPYKKVTKYLTDLLFINIVYVLGKMD